ncbi:MAG: ATP-binding protein [Acidimicrobiales bacterium]
MTASELAHQPIELSRQPSRARQQVRELLHEIEWEGDADEVVLAVHEALVNAQRHAGAVLRAQVALEASSLVIMVWDTGPGFDLDLHARQAPDPLAERGRGLWLIDRVTSTCEVGRDDDGVVLVMRFDRP